MKSTWPCIAVAAGALKFQACRCLDSSVRVSQAAASIAAHCSTVMIAMQNRSFKRPSSIVPPAVCLFLLFNAYSAYHRRRWHAAAAAACRRGRKFFSQRQNDCARQIKQTTACC
jgi:hypothetical protein